MGANMKLLAAVDFSENSALARGLEVEVEL